MAKIGFLFGAGAERYYRLPSGADYVQDTLCTRKKELYEALEDFYSGRAVEGYANSYKAEFLLAHNRNAYRRMVELSVQSALGIKYDNEETEKSIVELCYGRKVSYAEHEIFRDKVQKAYTKYRKYHSNDKVPQVKISIDSIIRVLYMLSLRDDLSEANVGNIKTFAEQNRNLKSELYYLLFEGVEEKNKPGKDQIRFEQYDNLSEFDKKFIAHFVKSNLKYYGTVEQDFSTIINPQRAGIVRFWRLVNYFWSAYFSILIPMIELSPKSNYRRLVSNEKQIYRKLLNTGADGQPFLIEMLHHLASEDYLEESVNNANRKPYYAALKEKFDEERVAIDFVLTTNYTPYVKTLGLEDNRYCYLAGSVFQFEFPYELRTIDVLDNAVAIKSNDLIFPYIMTQAPVKPIIEPRLIREYNRAIEYLDKCDLLVILGYSLCENDNHVNSLLREYITKPNNRMLVCHYYKPSQPKSEDELKKIIEEEKQSVHEKLRIENCDHVGEIYVILNEGDATNCAKEIVEYIYADT